ncbi:MAG: hypothetical protein ABSF41_10955 [Pseudolabrys sp.]
MQADANKKCVQELIVFGDVHYASYWDHVADIIAHRDDILNPNTEFERFLAHMSTERSDVAVVNLGDAIDYFLCDYETTPATATNNRDLFYAALDAAGLVCDEILGNHDFRLVPYNLRFGGLSQINLRDQECQHILTELGHGRLRNPLTELRSLARLGSRIDPLRNFRGFQKPAFERRASFNRIFLNTRGDLLGRAIGLGHAAWQLLCAVVARQAAGLQPSLRRLSVDCAGLDQADLAFIDRTLRECGPETTIVFMHAPVINPARTAIGGRATLTLRRLGACLQAQGYAHNVIAAGGEGLLRIVRSPANVERNIVIIAAHVHCARYILIDKASLIARQVHVEELNAAWNNARYIKHITALPVGVIDPAAGGTCTGYGRIGRSGFAEVVLRRFEQGRCVAASWPQAKPTAEPLLERAG